MEDYWCLLLDMSIRGVSIDLVFLESFSSFLQVYSFIDILNLSPKLLRMVKAMFLSLYE